METTKVGAVEKSKYKLKCEKDRNFKWQMVEALVYYCSNNGEDYLPKDEKSFLTAVILGLSDIAGIEYVQIEHCYPNPNYWVDDVEKALNVSLKTLDTDELPYTLHNTFSALEKILELKWDDDEMRGREHENLLMAFFKDIRNFSNCGDKKWKLCQQQIMDIEKKLIPHLLSLSWGTLHFIKILAEKTKKHLKKHVESKYYIDT